MFNYRHMAANILLQVVELEVHWDAPDTEEAY